MLRIINFLQNTDDLLKTRNTELLGVREYNLEGFRNQNINQNQNQNQNINQNQNQINNKNKIKYDTHRCFGIDMNGKSIELDMYNNPVYCQSYHKEIGQNGVWDAPCKNNENCKINGICNKLTGICEYPNEPRINVIGYTTIAPNSQRLCNPGLILKVGDTGIADSIVNDDLYCPV